MSLRGNIAARELMLALRARLDAGELAANREFDRLIIADLEMQKWVILDAAPVAAVKREVADEIDRARHMAPGALSHDEEKPVAHFFRQKREEGTRQIGPSPFARARVHVESEEGVEMRLGDVAAAHPFDGNAVAQGLAALAPDHLALARGERTQEVLEILITRVQPVKLPVEPLEKAPPRKRVPIGLVREGDMGR